MSRTFSRRLVLGMLLLNLLVISLAAFSIYEDRQEHVQRASTNVQNLSHLLANDISSVFDRSDLVLLTVVHEIERQLKGGKVQRAELEKLMLQQHAQLREALSLRVTDAQGIIRFGEGIAANKQTDIGDREHFILQRENPQAGLVIGKPVLGRINREWIIPLTRRYSRANGEFAGVVSINIPVAYFVNYFSKLDMGSQGLIVLRSSEHYSMARYPVQTEGGGTIGQFAISEQLRGLLKSNPEQITYVAPSPADKVERIYNYHKLNRYPLYVVSGLSMRVVMDEWMRDTLQILAMVAMFGAATLGFSYFLSRSWRRQLQVGDILRENEQRLRIALESGNFVVWEWEIKTGRMRFSRTSKQPFGCGDEESIVHIEQWRTRIHPEDRERVNAATLQHFNGATDTLETELRFRCASGSWKWLQIRGMVVARAADGKPLRMSGLHADISERKSREEDLRLAATVFNLADVAMLVSNASNEIISVNPAFTTITGYMPEEVIGRNPRMFSARTHGREFYQAMWSALVNEGSWSGEVTNRKKDGQIFIEWLTIRRVLNDKGEVTHHVAVFSDITERKTAEARVQHLALHDALTDLPTARCLPSAWSRPSCAQSANNTRWR